LQQPPVESDVDFAPAASGILPSGNGILGAVAASAGGAGTDCATPCSAAESQPEQAIPIKPHPNTAKIFNRMAASFCRKFKPNVSGETVLSPRRPVKDLGNLGDL
jgi:hypothetical protein